MMPTAYIVSPANQAVHLCKYSHAQKQTKRNENDRLENTENGKKMWNGIEQAIRWNGMETGLFLMSNIHMYIVCA